MRWNAVAFSFILFFPVAAFGAQDAPKQPGDVYVFFNALALSYNNYHPEARIEFQKYQDNHAGDLLSRLRIMYDRTSEVHFKDMDQATYQQLLDQVNAAIGIFETKGCSDTDLAGITANTVDCDYVGAALYSFRAALRANHVNLAGKYKIREALHADDGKFLEHARKSKSTQAQFLLGIHEYELSKSFFGSLTGDPHGRREALERIKHTLADESPFADDVWFYLLRQEVEDPGVARMLPDVPPVVLIAHLQLKYPNNKYPPDKQH